VDCELLGWPPDGPTLRLDHEQFAYAGKFVMSDTGKAVGREAGDVVAAASFSPDRTDESVLRIRYLTVRVDRRSEGLGPRLAAFVAERADDQGFETVKIAVNNPYAYEAMYRAGFAFTGKRTGLAELVLARPHDGTPGDYRAGLARFAERDLGDDERDFVETRRERGPPG
jgi:GNAT superfamily N-acetyltransferase